MGLVVYEIVINNMNSIFEVDNPFRQITTIEEKMEVLNKNSGYIEPEEIESDTAFDRKVGGYFPVLVSKTFQYAPIIKVLELVLSSSEVRETIHSEQSSPDGILGWSIDCRILEKASFLQSV